MKIKLIFRSLACLFFFIAIGRQPLYSQAYQTKAGGICIRIDDDQELGRWKQFSSVFEKYGYNFSFAIYPNLILNNAVYIDYIKHLQSLGDDLLDHTPDHHTNYFTSSNPYQYQYLKGIDHINNEEICLSYEGIDTTTYKDEGLINIDNNIVISQKNGEFKSVNPDLIPCIFVPKFNKLFKIYNLKNANSLDPDTLGLTSFWDEPVSGYKETNLKYEKIGIYDVKLSDEGLQYLVNKSISLFTSMGITRPLFWAQPGANNPQLRKDQVKRVMGDNCGFRGAATYPSPSYKVFCEANPNNDKQYAMQWGQITPEESFIPEMKKTIAQEIAKHKVLISSGHFNGFLLKKPNGWNDFLVRIDSLLAWCKLKNVPVLTNLEWTDKLYYQKQNPYENIFPSLTADLDENGKPDGFDDIAGITNGVLDKTDGVKESNFYSYSIDKPGVICSVTELGGIEKGENVFNFWSKAAPGSIIHVTFTFPGSKSSYSYDFLTSTEGWVKYSLENSSGTNKSLVVPLDASLVNISIKCLENMGKPVKISGLKLQAKSKANILPPWELNAKVVSEGVTLKWIDNSENEAGFVIERKGSSEDGFKQIDTVTAGQDAYVDRHIVGKDSGKICYRIRAYEQNDYSDYSNEADVLLSGVSTETTNNNVVHDYVLYQNYPNPFNPTTTITFNVADDSFVEIVVYNVMGEKIATLLKEEKLAGKYRVNWDATENPSGVYLYKISTVPQNGKGRKFSAVNKMLLLH